MPIEGVVLQMKSMHIDAVVNFPFPTAPDRLALRKAESILTHLGALKVPPVLSSDSSQALPLAAIGGKVTDLGRAMSLFPLSPRFSKMIVSGRQQGCLPYVITIVSALSVGDPFLREEVLGAKDSEVENDEEEELSHITEASMKAREAKKIRRRAFFQTQQVKLSFPTPKLSYEPFWQSHASLGNSTSDIFRMLSVVGAYEYAGRGDQFCAEHFVRPKVQHYNVSADYYINCSQRRWKKSTSWEYKLATSCKPTSPLRMQGLSRIWAHPMIFKYVEPYVPIYPTQLSAAQGVTSTINCWFHRSSGGS
jgi:ATP-dependent RNA helicase DHX37/DHR1